MSPIKDIMKLCNKCMITLIKNDIIFISLKSSVRFSLKAKHSGKEISIEILKELNEIQNIVNKQKRDSFISE
jgi:hypothetical protein